MGSLNPNMQELQVVLCPFFQPLQFPKFGGEQEFQKSSSKMNLTVE